MEYTSVQKLARVLKILIIILFVANIIALLIVPGLVQFSYDITTGEWGGVNDAVRDFLSLWNYEWDDALANLVNAPFWTFGPYGTVHAKVLTLFLWVCGTCTAIILWQGKRVVESILKEDTFSFDNAANMMRVAICCFVISGAALARLVWSITYYGSAMSIVSYNALFIPVFLIAGLVCMVMSALFRQAAELKAENDLTI